MSKESDLDPIRAHLEYLIMVKKAQQTARKKVHRPSEQPKVAASTTAECDARSPTDREAS